MDTHIRSWRRWHSVEKHGEDGVWNLPLGREPKEEEVSLLCLTRLMLFKLCFLRFYMYKYCYRRKAAVVLRQVAENLRFDCGQYGSFAVFAVYLQFLAVLFGRRVTENRRVDRISVKLVLVFWSCDSPAFNRSRWTVDCNLWHVVHTHCFCYQAVSFGASVSRGVNRHTVRHTGLVTMVLQLWLVPWWGT